MNRRKLLALFGASPVAAALPEMVKAMPITPVVEDTAVDFPVGTLQWHTSVITVQPDPYDPLTYLREGFARLKIYDGENWLDWDSQAGLDVFNNLIAQNQKPPGRMERTRG